MRTHQTNRWSDDCIKLSYECVVKNLKNILKSYVNIIVLANKQMRNIHTREVEYDTRTMMYAITSPINRLYTYRILWYNSIGV